MLYQLILILLLGGIGAVSRYLINVFTHKYIKTNYSIGTITANMLGCFLAGIIWSLPLNNLFTIEIKLALLAGFCGALTTFSTWMVQISDKIGAKEYRMVLIEVIGALTVGIILFLLGIIAAS